MILEYAARAFRSEEDLCRAYKFPFQTFLKLKNDGKSIPEIMLELAPRNEKAMVYQGVVYANRKHLCEALGLDYYRFRSAFERTGNMEQSVEFAKTPSASRKPFAARGKTYSNYMEFCEDTGMPYPTLINMIYVRGMTVEEAYDTFLDNQKNKPVFAYDGKTYPSLRSLCLQNGFSYTSIHAQMRQGASLEEAIAVHLQRMKEPKKGGSVSYHGKKYRSLFALTKELGCSYPRVYAALGRGLTLEEAIKNEEGREDPAGNSGSYRSMAMIYKGEEYPSLTVCLQKNGIAFATYYRKKQAMPEGTDPAKIVDAILSDPKYQHRKAVIHEDIVIHGKQYATQKEAAQDLGISMTSIVTIMRKQGLSFEDAVDERLRRQKKRKKKNQMTSKKAKQPAAVSAETKPEKEAHPKLVIKGEEFSSKQAACKKYGLTAYKVKKVMVNQNLSFADAAEFLIDGGDADKSDPVTINGHTYSSISSVLTAYEISFDFFQERRSQSSLGAQDLIESMIADMPEQKNVVAPIRKQYIVNGQTFSSKKQALESVGLSEYRVNNYMNQHQCSFESAIEILSTSD